MSAPALVPDPRATQDAGGGLFLAPILLVDDDSAKRFSLNRLLSPLGYTIVEADSGPAALRCVLAQDFAVILLDVRMPGMDGLEVADLIRKRQRSELTPIVLTTASTSAELAASGQYDYSATGYMFIATEPDEVRAMVSTFVKLFLKAQQLAAQALQMLAAADHWKLLTEKSPMGIFHTDRQNRYVYTNPRWSQITGIPAEAAVGQHWEIILGPGHLSRLHDVSTENIVPPTEVAQQIELLAPGSVPRSVLLTSNPIPDGTGGTAGWLGTLTDITSLRGPRTGG